MTEAPAMDAMMQLPAEDTAPPPGPLGITEERLMEITNTVTQRLSDLRVQMGLDMFPTGSTSFPVLCPIGREGTWIWIRQVSRYEYRGKYTHRRALGGVFLENGPNGGWSLQIPKRFVDALATKAEDDLIGSDIFFSGMPENIDDPQQAKLSKQVELKLQKAIEESNVRECLAESIRVALIEGERCVKLTYDVDKTQYVGDAEVLIVDEQPFKTPSGDYIYRKDDVLVMVVDAQGNPIRIYDGQTPLATDQMGQPAEFIQSRLEKEPSVVMPEQPQWQLVQGLVMTILHKSALEAFGLFTEDFIYDIYTPTLEKAKLMAHVYDMPREEIEANYPGTLYGQRLKSLSVTGPMAQASLPIYDAGEQQRVAEAQNLVNIHETYYRCRVLPTDEHESWLFLVIDMTNRVPIYAEYLGNMKMKRPPFGLIRGLRSEPGRAYGVGIYADFRDQNLAIDVTFNRLMLKDSKEGSITFQNPAMIKELQEGHKLVIGGKEIYNINPNYPDDVGPKTPPVFRINLNEMDKEGWEIIDKLVSGGQLQYGVVSIGELEASDSGIGAGGTATATRNIERTGIVLQKSTQRMMASDILKVMDMAIDLILENSDPEELMWVPGEQELAQLNREEIRNLPRDVRLTLTRSKGSEVLATNAQATQLVMQYLQLPLSIRADVRTFYVNQLQALEVPDASSALKEPTEEELAQEAQANANKPPETRETLTASLKDIGALTAEERSQVLGKYGIRASPPDQVMAVQQMKQLSDNPPQPEVVPKQEAA